VVAFQGFPSETCVAQLCAFCGVSVGPCSPGVPQLCFATPGAKRHSGITRNHVIRVTSTATPGRPVTTAGACQAPAYARRRGETPTQAARALR
jgi:hypothetical protein